MKWLLDTIRFLLFVPFFNCGTRRYTCSLLYTFILCAVCLVCIVASIVETSVLLLYHQVRFTCSSDLYLVLLILGFFRLYMSVILFIYLFYWSTTDERDLWVYYYFPEQWNQCEMKWRLFFIMQYWFIKYIASIIYIVMQTWVIVITLGIKPNTCYRGMYYTYPNIKTCIDIEQWLFIPTLVALCMSLLRCNCCSRCCCCGCKKNNTNYVHTTHYRKKKRPHSWNV